jgi:5-methylcytosine-specific restriction endonuclease McrA
MAGSDFPPSAIREGRRLAAFKRCLGRDEMGDDVHHIVPKAEDGEGVIENAVLLCVRCHSLCGHRRDKREQIRQARDLWSAGIASQTLDLTSDI